MLKTRRCLLCVCMIWPSGGATVSLSTNLSSKQRFVTVQRSKNSKFVFHWSIEPL
jgi:hypothetical protein